MAINRIKKSSWLIFITALGLFTAGLTITCYNYAQFKEYQRQEIEKKLKLQEKVIQERLEAWRFNLALLSFNPYIIDSLSAIYNPSVKENIRDYLSKIAEKSGFISIFLLDEKGNCILSTDPRFENKNYGFRPYFKQAMKNGTGTYLALGVTSKKLGLYLSRKVKSYVETCGVLVVKIDPFALLKSLIPPDLEGFEIWGCTNSGVMFSPGREGFYVLNKRYNLNNRLGDARQFEGVKFKELGFSNSAWEENFPPSTAGTLDFEKDGKNYSMSYFPLIPNVLYVLTIVSEDFMLPSLQMLQHSLKLSNGAMLAALIPLIAGLFLVKRQHDAISMERIKKNISEYRYKAVLKGNKDSFVVMDTETLTVTEANDKFYKLLDLDPEETAVSAISFPDIIIHKDRDAFMERAFKDNDYQDFVFTTEIKTRGNDFIPVVIDFTRYDSESELGTFCYAFIQDLRQGLRDANRIKLLETAVEQSGSSIVITDNKGYIQYVNPAFTRVTGYDREEALGKKTSILSSDIHDDSFYASLWETIKSGKVWFGRFCNKKKDGSLFWEDATIAPVQNEAGEIIHFIAIKHDITELVALEEELNQKVSELEGIMEHAGVGIALVQNRKFLMVNSTLASIIGASREEIQGTSSLVLFNSIEEYKEFGNMFYPKLVEGKTVSYEIERTFNGGDRRWFQVTATAINPGSMESMKTVWVGHDITQLKKLHLDLEEAKQKAEEANRAKSTFIANISHEIRTPLNGIMGMLSILKTTELDRQQEEYIDIAHTSAESLLFLINDILDISKIEAGKIELDLVDFNLPLLLDNCAKAFLLAAREKGVDFTLHIADQVPSHIKGDPVRLRQVLVNLMGNALKFTEKGSINVTVELLREESDKVVLIFSIKDTGIGIPPEKIDRLFKNFSQVDSSISRKFGGTGLGLAISKNIVEMMEGRIDVESEPDKGSTFWFTAKFKRSNALPDGSEVYQNNNEHQIDDKEPIRSLRFQGHVLVVDDNPVNQQVAVGLLKALGLSPDVANNGQECIEMLSKSSYDIIFMDIQMPILDGVKATRIIRKDPKLKDLPIIALTAHAFKEEISKCNEAGMNGYITKPIDPIKLVQILKKWLPFKRIESDRKEKSKRGGDAPAYIPDSGDNKQSQPLFDKDDFLNRTLNDRQLASNIIGIFIENTYNILKSMQKETDSKNFETVSKLAHTLKGSAASISAIYLSSLALELEKNAKLKSSEDIKEQIKRIENAFEKLKNSPEIQEYLAAK